MQSHYALLADNTQPTQPEAMTSTADILGLLGAERAIDYEPHYNPNEDLQAKLHHRLDIPKPIFNQEAMLAQERNALQFSLEHDGIEQEYTEKKLAFSHAKRLRDSALTEVSRLKDIKENKTINQIKAFQQFYAGISPAVDDLSELDSTSHSDHADLNKNDLSTALLSTTKESYTNPLDSYLATAKKTYQEADAAYKARKNELKIIVKKRDGILAEIQTKQITLDAIAAAKSSSPLGYGTELQNLRMSF